MAITRTAATDVVPAADGPEQDHVAFSVRTLIDAAELLEQSLDGSAADGALVELQERGLVTAEQVGDWDAGRSFAAAAQATQRSVAQVYEDLLNQVRTATELLRESAAVYDAAERTLLARVQRVATSHAGQTASRDD